jgi:AcrR family transcriptional regulator
MAANAAPASRAVRVDGRRLRTERTKQLIIDAFLELASAHSPRLPTAAETAERAGYSVRSVFERFPDMLSLRIAATDWAMDQAIALVPPHLADGDRQARIKYQVEIRARVCDRWMRLWHGLVTNQSDSEELKLRIGRSRRLTIERLEVTYARELATLSALERTQTLIALEAVTDAEAWARMREHFGLSFDEACAAWIQAVDGMLPPTPLD